MVWNWRGIPVLIGVLVALFSLVGCQTYRIEPMLEHYRVGNLEAAYEEVVDPPWYRPRTKHDRLAWDLEEAKLLHDMQRYAESTEVFSQALERFRVYAEEEANLSVSNELKGILGGQVLREYRSNYAEAILGETYLALNDLALGDPKRALTGCVRASDWQSSAELEFEKEIARNEELAGERGFTTSEIDGDERVQGLYADLEAHVNSAYADYLNPFATFVSAVVNFALGDERRAMKDLEEVAGMVRNQYVADLWNGRVAGDQETVYVLFEQGLAPGKEQFTIPIFTSRGLSPISIPVLTFDPLARTWVRVQGEGIDLRTEGLVSMNSVVAKQFKHDLPGIIVRTIIGALAREGISLAAEKQLEDSIGFYGKLLTSLYKAATAGADIRTWRSVGSDYQIAVFPRPSDSRLTLSLEGVGVGPQERLQLPQGNVVVVLARSMNPGVLIVHEPFDATGKNPRVAP